MKKTSVGLICVSLAISAMAVQKTELDNRIRALGVKLEAMQQKHDNGQFLSVAEILFQHKVKPTEAALELADKLNAYCRVAQN